MRIPMTRRESVRWIADDDVEVRQRLDPPRAGRKVEVIVSEDTLRQIGARALEHAVERAGVQFALQHQGEIARACLNLLIDPKWLKPIIEDEVRQAARQMVMSLWSDDEKAALRGWFDVLASAAKGKDADV